MEEVSGVGNSSIKQKWISRMRGENMPFKLERIEDKVEFFEAVELRKLEKMIDEQIENNKALLLHVHSVQHQVIMDPQSGKRLYTAVVHFKAK